MLSDLGYLATEAGDANGAPKHLEAQPFDASATDSVDSGNAGQQTRLSRIAQLSQEDSPADPFRGSIRIVAGCIRRT